MIAQGSRGILWTIALLTLGAWTTALVVNASHASEGGATMQNRTRAALIGATLAAAILAGSAPAQAQSSPRQTVEAANQEIQNLLSKQLPEDSPAATKRDESLRQVVTNLLDLDHMAQKALGRLWRERTDEERQEYVTLMKQLVERSYLRQARSRTQYTVQFGNVSVDGGEAEVETTLNFTSGGRRQQIEIIYTMAQRDGRWQVTDVETDGASTVRNYRAQFRRIIQEHGFEELVSRMRRRLEAGEADI